MGKPVNVYGIIYVSTANTIEYTEYIADQITNKDFIAYLKDKEDQGVLIKKITLLN